MAFAMMSGTSAFAETRHRDETWRNDRNGAQTQQTQTQQTAQSRSDLRNSRNGANRGDRNDTRSNPNSGYRNETRNNPDSSYRNETRNDSNRGYRNDTRNESFRNESRRNSNDGYRNESRGNSNYGYRGASRSTESFHGRVSRVEHFGGGYRVWVGGARYPFFISGDRWSRFPIRVGLGINLGGYWNPAGYYDVYDVGPYATSGDLHGVVESVDYRRGTAVMRDDVSGSFVTIVLRGNDPRLGSLRPGDYVELTGAWNRAGVFDAYNVAALRGGGYGQYDGYGRPDGY